MINLEFPTLNLKETGNRIKTLRVNSGYTVEDIAGYMGFSGPQAVYKWEWGGLIYNRTKLDETQ